MKLQGRMNLMVLIPALVIGVMGVVVGSMEVKSNLESQIKEEMKVTAYLGAAAYEKIKDSDAKEQEVNAILDLIYKNGGLHASVFEGDVRKETTILKESGERDTGTKASETITAKVKEKGEEYFTESSIVAGTEYYAYYVPVIQPDTGKVIGMFATANPKSEVTKAFLGLVFKISAGILFSMVVSVLVINYMIKKLTKTIGRNVMSLKLLATGDLNGTVASEDLARKDEIGDMGKATRELQLALTEIIGEVQDSVAILQKASGELGIISAHTSDSTGDIESAIEEIASSATSLAQSAEEVSDHTFHMGEEIDRSAVAARQLEVEAEDMKNQGEAAIHSMGELDYINQRTLSEIREIYDQTNQTNEYAKKIQNAAEVIHAIAEETNLLSLNASIEAARAGESGKGFAVVAEQIKKLSDQSSASSKEIAQIIHTLMENSDRAVDTMKQVNHTIQEQSSKIQSSMENFTLVDNGIRNSCNRIAEISALTTDLNNLRTRVAGIVVDLGAISEENAASTEETSAATTQMASAVKDIGRQAGMLQDLAAEMVASVSRFKRG